MAKPYMMPDQQAAGVNQPEEPMSQAGLVDALRSRGTLPSGLAQTMIPTGGANAGLAFGSGVLNALSGGNAALNPYLAQQQEQQNRQFWQLQHVRQQQLAEREREFKRNELAANMLKGSLETMDEGPARDHVAKQYGAMYSKMTGIPFTGELAVGLATKKISTDVINRLITDAGLGLTPELLARKYNLALDKVQGILQTDPATLERLGADNALARQTKVSEARLKDAQAFAAEHPEFAGDPKLTGLAARLHLQFNTGKGLREGTADSINQAFEAARLQLTKEQEAAELRKYQYQSQLSGQQFTQQSQLQAQRDVAAEERARIAAANSAKGKEAEKRKSAVAVLETFMNQYEEAIGKLDSKGFLPRDSGVKENLRAASKQGRHGVLGNIPGYSEPNDQDWRAWLDLQGNLVGFARTVQNEIGPRAMAAFHQAFRVSQEPPTKAGLEKILKNMRDQLKASETGEVVPVGGSTRITKEQYEKLRAKGYADADIRAKYGEPQ